MVFEEAAREYLGRKDPTADIESVLDHAEVESLSAFAKFFYERGEADAKRREEMLRQEIRKVYTVPY